MTELQHGDLGLLSDLQSALDRFAAGAQQALRTAHREVQSVQEWVQERQNHWQRQVDMAHHEAMAARDALQTCLASGYRDEHGNYYPPNCSREERILAQAEAHLRECDHLLGIVVFWSAQVDQANVNYRRAALRLQDLTEGHTERARAYLVKARINYESVIAAADLAALGGALAGYGANLAVALSAVSIGAGLAIGREHRIIGEAAEGVAQDVAAGELGYRVVRYDRRNAGFDSILQGPDGQYILLESKAYKDGKVKLDTGRGGHRKASVGWVAAVARDMSRPGSDLHSETNAQIGRSILERGPANVPMLLAITNKSTGEVAIYQRTGPDARSADWEPLAGGLPVQLED